MNKVKKRSFFDRIYDAVRAFQGKPIGSVTYGVNVQRCDECEHTIKPAMYLCDREACGDKCPNPDCKYTYNIEHAVNFELLELCSIGGALYREIDKNEES